MKLIRTTRLLRRQKNSDIVCEIDLCQLPGSSDRYLVNMRQGRAGEEWRESTRTPQPVDLASAETLFALVRAERAAQGFVDPDAIAPEIQDAVRPAQVPPASPKPTAADIVLLEKLTGAHWKKLSQQQRSRVIWRIGERRLRAAVPALIEQIQRGDAMQDYCIAWSIGRCGDAGAAVAMRELHARGTSDPVRRMALQSWLMLAGDAARRTHADALLGDWPAWLRELWTAQDEQTLSALPALDERWNKLPLNDWLEQLDQVALAHPLARRILLAQLRRLPLQAGVFRAVRHIYKAAELRADAELFGVLHHRFETSASSATTSNGMYIRRKWVPFAEEAARPDSTVAYSVRTRGYLLRRGWRTLRRLGQAADPAYIPLALGALAEMRDDTAGEAHERDGRFHDRYGHWLLFNRMLRAKGAWRVTRSGLSWYKAAAITAPQTREEAFPELWDAHPEALLWLMQHSQCEGVHQFAALALIDNTAYCAALPLDIVRDLLRSPYQAAARFAFALCRARFAPGVPDTDWLMLLLQSNLPEALQYALDCISRDPARYCADALLVATIACSHDEGVRRQGRLLCQCALAQDGQPRAIVLHLLDWLDNCADLDHAEAVVPPIAADLLWLLQAPLKAAGAEAPYERLLGLLRHRLASVRILAGEWLLLHNAPPSALPGTALAALLQENDAGVRSVGVKLFSALPDHLLAGQAQLIYAFCTNADAGVRRAIDPVMQRLGPSDPAFRAALSPMLIDVLFRSESSDGMHADVAAWIAGPLKDADALSDRALLVRLLAARSKGAQQLGALLLPRHQPQDMSIAQLTAMGCNPNASVRAWAFAAMRADPARVRAELEPALRLFDSRFDDSIAFATEFFQTQCRREDWTPLLLVSLCDHLAPAVQRFGRSMITSHFDVADVTEFMLKLSQHPSASMQLFVSAWLESACAGELHKLERLEPYFLTVLSQVHRGRVVKNRAQTFLREQALLSEAIAAFVARLFARQVLTVAIADKAQYIEGLRAIRERFPNLPEVLTIHAPRALAAGRNLP